MAKSRQRNQAELQDYLLSPIKREAEDPLDEEEGKVTDPNALRKALFYMYGACELVNDERVNKKIVVHNLLRRYQIWDGTVEAAENYLQQQIVIEADDSQA